MAYTCILEEEVRDQNEGVRNDRKDAIFTTEDASEEGKKPGICNKTRTVVDRGSLGRVGKTVDSHFQYPYEV